MKNLITIKKAQLEVLTVCKPVHAEYARMSDGFDYSFKEFLDAPVGTRFAVVKSFDNQWASGTIELCQRIADNDQDQTV